MPAIIGTVQLFLCKSIIYFTISLIFHPIHPSNSSSFCLELAPLLARCVAGLHGTIYNGIRRLGQCRKRTFCQ